MGHQCYHCKQWVDAGEAHDCWTTTEAALTRDLPEDLRDAWERLRESAVEFGDQRIYASHHSIMFARKACYFFVRPKRSSLEVCVFLGRRLNAARVRRVVATSKTKFAHLLQIRHRDEVEPPITDWLREAYGLEDAPKNQLPGRPRASARKKTTGTLNPRGAPSSDPRARRASPARDRPGAPSAPRRRRSRRASRDRSR